ncbi:MAG: DUF4397 domain-containing protein [Labilithrix sp.]|nr:DUF4397 domain-containing protein [Labilithrix sp.]MCW5813980.1 DUF4397 domain-containing protein [Labilithrix sp.]
MQASFFRTLILGGLFVSGATGVALTSLTACESLSQTSPVPDGDASDLDASQPPPEAEDTGTSSSSTTGGPGTAPPPSGRIRVANMLEGSPNMDLCVREGTGAFAPGWITGSAPLFSGVGKPDGLAYGEVSQHAFVNVGVEGNAGVSFAFRFVEVGSPCDGAGAVIFGTSAGTVIRQGGGVTVYVYGRVEEGVDAGDANPKVAAISDTITPPGSATLLRVVHGVIALPSFDVVINGETVLQGIRYGTAFTGPPYAAVTPTAPPPPGFASIQAGVPEEATMTLRAGTTVRSFTIPNRLRRGIASTVFASGTADRPLVQLCSDRTPAEGVVASCVKLVSTE